VPLEDSQRVLNVHFLHFAQTCSSIFPSSPFCITVDLVKWSQTLEVGFLFVFSSFHHVLISDAIGLISSFFNINNIFSTSTY
jgi:hypothetical protein